MQHECNKSARPAEKIRKQVDAYTYSVYSSGMTGMENMPIMAQALADAIGARKRQVQIWTDAGILRCLSGTDRQGRGKQRLYDPSEKGFAALAARMADVKTPIGDMSAWMGLVREVVAKGDPKEGLPAEAYRAALAGEMDSWLIYARKRALEWSERYGWVLNKKDLVELLMSEPSVVVVNVVVTMKEMHRRVSIISRQSR